MMDIKFNLKSIDKAAEETKIKVQSIIKSPALLSELADVAIKDIKFQTRKGVNSVTGGKFIPLSESWIRQRQKIAKTQTTHDAYSARKSNLTLTGQLLDSMRKKIIDKGVRIYFFGIHKGYYKGAKSIQNEELAQHVAKIRPFFHIRDSLIAQLKSVVIRYIRRKL